MQRIEIIGNVVLLEEFMEHVEKRLKDQHYTVLPVLYGKGYMGKAYGDDVWMEKNFLFLAFVSDEEGHVRDELKSICDGIKRHSTKNALAMFVSAGVERGL